MRQLRRIEGLRSQPPPSLSGQTSRGFRAHTQTDVTPGPTSLWCWMNTERRKTLGSVQLEYVARYYVFSFAVKGYVSLTKGKVYCLLMSLTQHSCLLNSLRWLTYFYNESWSKFPHSYSVFGNSLINRNPMRRFSNLISKKEVKYKHAQPQI